MADEKRPKWDNYFVDEETAKWVNDNIVTGIHLYKFSSEEMQEIWSRHGEEYAIEKHFKLSGVDSSGAAVYSAPISYDAFSWDTKDPDRGDKLVVENDYYYSKSLVKLGTELKELYSSVVCFDKKNERDLKEYLRLREKFKGVC